MNQTELPQDLKRLYKHWHSHTMPAKGTILPQERFADTKLFEEMLWFISERMNIWDKKTKDEEPPFTTDPVLSTYRFCNIFRELDRQTIAFHTLLEHLQSDPALWLLNMFYCRVVARPETIAFAGLLSFNKNHNKLVHEKLMYSPRPRFGTPYVFPVSVIQRGSTPTRELFATQYLPLIMQRVAEEIQTWNKMSVYDGVRKVLPIFRHELQFHWTEVLIDTAYQFPQFIDLFDRFPIGPGAAPTLVRINSSKDPSVLVTDLSRINLDTKLTYNGSLLRLSAENWEGIACEFRKYTNLKSGTGRRRLYKNEDTLPPQTDTLF